MSEVKNIFTFNEEELTKVGGKFGINLNATLVEIRKETTPNRYKMIKVIVRVGDTDYNGSIFINEKAVVFDDNGQRKELSKGQQGYGDALFNNYKHNIAALKHILKATGITEEEMNKKLSAITSKDDTLKALEILGKMCPKNTNVDIFLQYQNKLSGNYTTKFLEVPVDMKGGRFISAPSGFDSVTEVKEGTKTLYANPEGTEFHPIYKEENFWEMNRSKKVNDEDQDTQNTAEDKKAAESTGW